MYCFQCHHLNVSGLRCAYCGVDHFQAFLSFAKPLAIDSVFTRKQYFDEIRRLVAVIPNAHALIGEIESANTTVRNLSREKVEDFYEKPRTLPSPDAQIPDLESPPVVLKAKLLEFHEAYGVAKGVLKHLYDLNQQLNEHNAIEARLVRRQLLIREIKALKANDALEYLMANPEICSVSDIPDQLRPAFLRGTPSATYSVSGGGYDAWREQH